MDMNGDIQNAERVHTCEIREKYLPYTCTELTSKHIQYAKNYLNETEESREEALKEMKKLIKEELDVFSALKDIHLLSFPRASMSNLQDTCLLMKNAAEFLNTYKNYFNKISTEILRRVIESKVLTILPYRDAKGRAICLGVIEYWDPADLKTEEMIFGYILALLDMIENPLNQVAGQVLILNCKGASFSHFKEFMGWYIFGVRSSQNCPPASLREIHLLHTPSFVQLAWNAVKPLVNEDIKKKIFFYDSTNWESLHEKISPCILPEEVGGHLGPYSFEHWASDIPNKRKKFSDLLPGILDE